MIAFNFNIHFQDEPTLDDGIYNNNKQDFLIRENSELCDSPWFAIATDYEPLSNRDVKYFSQCSHEMCGENSSWGIEIKDVLFFSWNSTDSILTYNKLSLYTPKLLEFWVLHTLLPIVFTMQKRYDILHVGAVEIDGDPVIFSAPSFGGKSTMTDFFVRRGHKLVSDDTLGVYKKNCQYFVVPSYPYHRPFRKAETLGYKVTNVSLTPKPFQVVYLLSKGDEDAKSEVVELKGVAKYKAFHFSTFVNFTFLKNYHFQLAAEMAKGILVYKVTVPWSLDRIPDVYAAIVKHKKET